MAVFNVEATYTPNGNRTSRPVVADDAEQARQMAEAEWDIAVNDPRFTWVVTQQSDTDGITERLLLDAERRRLENEYYAFTPRRRRGR
jgi:hypothetical protein